MKNLSEIYKINPDLFILNDGHFDHKSFLHGTDHIYRVMVHTLIIGINEDMKKEARVAFFAAYIHDLARKHDGKCITHGEESAKEKLPLFSEFFLRQGISTDELSSIATAVKFHSKSHEIKKTHKDYIYTVILKDADALDRVRIGYDEPDEIFLRLQHTKKLVTFAFNFYNSTPHQGFRSFSDTLWLAEDLLKSNIYL